MDLTGSDLSFFLCKYTKGKKERPDPVRCYGPKNKLATKISVGIIPYENAEPIMTRWYCERGFDIRVDTKIMDEVLKMRAPKSWG